MKDHCEFPAFEGHRIQDNIIHIELKKIKKMTAEDVMQMYDCFEKCGGENGVYVLVSFKGYVPMSDEAMDEAKKQESQKFVKATAFVIKTAALRVGIKFFMNFYKPKRPMSIFGKKDEALVWLKKEKKMQMEKELSLS